MKRQLKNKVRALVLLTVFSLNTIAGFACSVGVDMGYNHHHLGEKPLHKHSHKQEMGNIHKYHLSTDKFKDAHSIDDCCSNDVTQFALLDKSVGDNNIHLEAPVILAFATTFFLQNINESGLGVNTRIQFVRRSCFLNDIDIQTAIRRFQI